MALEALYVNRSYERADWDRKAGVVIWECPNGEALGQQSALDGQPFPGVAYNPPVCTRAKIRFNALPGKAHITAWYTQRRDPGKARISGYCISKAKKPYLDQEGRIIQGAHTDGHHIWKPTTPVFSVDTAEAVLVKTAVLPQNFDLASIRDKVGCVNSDTLSNFGNARPGILLLWKIAYNKTEIGNVGLVYLDYLFLVDLFGWNNVQSQKCTLAITQTPIFASGVATGQTSSKVTLLAGTEYDETAGTIVDVDPEDRKPFPEASFSDLNGQIVW